MSPGKRPPSPLRAEGRGAGGSPSRAKISPRALLARAAKVKLLALDVDGVLTDCRIWYGPDGEALKAFHVRDGFGLVRLRSHVDLAIISGRPGKATQARVEELGFKHLVFGQADKLAGYAQLAHLGLADDEVAYMGDDVNDVPLLRRVGLSACPADAHPDVPGHVHFVARSPGGFGAVRELCDLILAAKGIRTL
ncbi:MAG TPA: HAD hydrolase family protein [Anaeromyxobacteraceae bacterium]|nr:HAD hydrolase family protein [Anaeromyxobacteraceae bacterium]